jgi:hypothetical protein
MEASMTMGVARIGQVQSSLPYPIDYIVTFVVVVKHHRSAAVAGGQPRRCWPR